MISNTCNGIDSYNGNTSYNDNNGTNQLLILTVVIRVMVVMTINSYSNDWA